MAGPRPHSRASPCAPRAALAGWLATVVVLGVVGLGVDGHLSASGLKVGGSESDRARTLVGASFDDGATVPVLLRGPRAEVKTQGRALARRLQRPRRAGAQPVERRRAALTLRPSRDRALLLVSLTGRTGDDRRAQAVERIAHQATSGPVRATVTGLPALNRDGNRASLSAVRRAELIALPLLLLALLAVFRSPLAAAIPAAFGAATIAAGTGAVALLAQRVALDAFSLALASMLGLALAVDYSLLMVSRLREERASEPDGPFAPAVARAVVPTVRTVTVAGAAIVAAMAAAAVLSPGTAVLSAALAVSVVALLAAAGAALAVPAALVLAGHHLDRFCVPARRATRAGISARLAAPPPAGRSSASWPRSLGRAQHPRARPAHRRAGRAVAARRQRGAREHDTVARTMGPGWANPFEIVAVTRSGAVTTPARLDALARAQRRLADDPAVRAVLGPGTIARSASRLRRAGRQALSAEQKRPARRGDRLRRLEGGVDSAATGVGALRGALSGATAAAARIATGSRDCAAASARCAPGWPAPATAPGSSPPGSPTPATARAAGLPGRRGAGRPGRRQRRGRAEQRPAHPVEQRPGPPEPAARRGRGAGSHPRGPRAPSAAQTEAAITAAQAALRFALRLRPARASAPGAPGARRGRRRRARRAAAPDRPGRPVRGGDRHRHAAQGGQPPGRVHRPAAEGHRRAQREPAGPRRLGRRARRRTATRSSERFRGWTAEPTGSARRSAPCARASTAWPPACARASNARRLAGGLDDARSAARGLRGPARGRPARRRRSPASFLASGYFLLAALESGDAAAPFGVNVQRGGQGARIVVVPRYDSRTRAPAPCTSACARPPPGWERPSGRRPRSAGRPRCWPTTMPPPTRACRSSCSP